MKVRHINWYADDWIGGVRSLSNPERGVYIDLINLYYSENGPIERNDAELARHCRLKVGVFRRILERLIAASKCSLTDGKLTPRRCQTELTRACERNERASASARNRWNAAAKALKSQQSEDAIADNPSNATAGVLNRVLNRVLNKEEEIEDSPLVEDTPPKPELQDHEHGRPKRNTAAWRPDKAHYDLAANLGYGSDWLDKQEQKYRDWLPNAKTPHRNFDAGFRNWLRRAAEENHGPRKPNGHDGGNKGLVAVGRKLLAGCDLDLPD